MRHYMKNSPQAAARIVSLAMLADGDVSSVELAALERHDVHHQIGLHHREMLAVLHGLCEDMLSTAQLSWADACLIPPSTLAELLDDIDDPELQLKVINLCVLVVEADAVIADGESIVLTAAVEQWGLQHWMLRSTKP